VAAETPAEQEREDRQLAESIRAETVTDPGSARVAIPSGWVRVAVDLDGDGTFDTIETLHLDDLGRARMAGASRQRQMSGAGGGGQEPAAIDPQQADQRPQSDAIELSGTVQEIREFPLSGVASPHRIARVATDQGTAKVDFGPADALHALEIQEGDEVTVIGQRGMINDRPVLMAQSVSKGEDAIEVESPDDGLIKRVRGEVVGTRTVVFRGHDEDHLITEIELRSGNRAEVILGPKSKLDGLELKEGDAVALLVRPAMLNGGPAMAAEQIRFGDEVIAVSDPVEQPVRTETDPLDADSGSDAEAEADEASDAPRLDAPRLSDDPNGASGDS
jgi:antitoxin component of MazEF toxin-antitoxin module